MADDKDFVAKLSRSKLEEIAKEIRTIEDHAERMEHAVKVVLGYEKSGKIEAEHRAPAMELLNPEGGYKDMWDKLYKPLDKAHSDNKSDLEASVVDQWMYKFADKIMPSMKVGTEGENAHNYHVMIDYLERADGPNGKGETKKKVKELIAKGHGAEAAAIIIGAIREGKKENDYEKFVKLLFPTEKEQRPYLEKVAHKIAESARSVIKDQGAEEKIGISEAKIGENLIPYFTLYARGDIKTIIDNTSFKKGKAENVGKTAHDFTPKQYQNAS